ncbi:arsenate reductase family protein [Salinicoccus carnicancri]|uniref:arsenate reductase family protein n=1 Tax=Salinicoccus carnicancri TaxID=558170 RepID=UPI0002FDB313|nr:arsenate reductase family protein [Salinicoccus carnicancri]
MITLYEYPKCTTCRKGRKFLEENDVDFQAHDMVQAPPSKEKLKEIISKSGNDIDDFFNKRGKKFKELELRDRLPSMSDDEKVDMLSSDGMLIRRPLAYDGEQVLLGFREDVWQKAFTG